MKSSILAVLLIAGIIHSAAAQYSFGQEQNVTFGVKGGINFSNIQQSGQQGTVLATSLTNLSIGAFADIPVSQMLSFQPGLFYSGKGYKANVAYFDVSGLSYTETEKTNFSYVQVPLNLMFNASSGGGDTFFAGAGPFAAVLVKAHTKGNIQGSYVAAQNPGSSGNENFDEDLPIGTADGIKRFDYGLNALAGFKLSSGALFSINYDLGLRNISGDPDIKINTRVFGVSIGYVFR